jgi:hypothetical protein
MFGSCDRDETESIRGPFLRDYASKVSDQELVKKYRKDGFDRGKYQWYGWNG